MSKKGIAIGIDLGTTYSCVGVFQNNRVEIIANDQGYRITPSCVAFTDIERHLGDAAKEQIAQNPANTVYNVKRLIGRKFDDPALQKDIKTLPFNVIQEENKPLISVTYKNTPTRYNPEQISAMVLGEMKEAAEAYIGESVTDAVITVPAYFNDSQRQATKDAGAIAGLNVLRILNEPTAAAIAYGVHKKTTEPKNILIYDLGGGTFDVVVLCIDNGDFEVRSVGGDTHLGGEDFDLRLLDHFVKEYARKNNNTDISGDARAMQRLKKACEKAKITLASSEKANLDIDSLFGGNDFHSSITRVRFNQLCIDLFKQTIRLVGGALNDAGLKREDLDEVVLVGGSTRIVKIRDLLTEFFDGRKLNMSMNPDEAVAYGAAVEAAVLVGDIPEKEVFLKDVAPLSLGIEIVGGYMHTIIKHNTRIPTKQTKRDFTTSMNNQTNLNIQVFEGKRKMTQDNHLLGSFILTDIENALRGVPSIDITFHLDSDGILQVSAEDCSTGSRKTIVITNNKGRLSKDCIDRMKVGCENMNREDRVIRHTNQFRARPEYHSLTSNFAAVQGALSNLQIRREGL
uniref:HSP70-like protein n=2 Tax=Hirondellea gigas TaxID=1518452 RepID=A0A2P2I6D8_9CRUS